MRLDKFENGLPITEREILALKIYQGASPIDRIRKKRYSSFVYRTMNAMLYSGIDNEIERVFRDDEILEIKYIEDAEELLEIMENLYSLSYKNATNMEEEEYGVRIDRVSSIEEMKKKEETISNFSVSTSGKYDFSFVKDKMALAEVNIKPKTICANINHILKGESRFPEEEEILVMPFNKVTIEEGELNEIDKRTKNSKGNEAKLKVYITVEPPEKTGPLTEEESKDKERAMKIFKEEGKREKAEKFLQDIQYEQMIGNSESQALETIGEESIKNYIEWKKAFKTVFKYEIREKQLEIDKQLEEIENKKEQKRKEITELTKERKSTDLKKVIEEIKISPKENMLKEFKNNIEKGE